MTPIRPCACVHDSLGAGRRPILFSGLDKFWIKGQARRVVDWGRKDAACGMAEEDGVKMSGLRLDRPAAPRLGCARGVTGVTGRTDTDEQTTRCRIISFHSAGEAFVAPLNEVTVGQSRSCFLYLSFSGAPRGTRVISWNEEGRSQREMRRRMKTCSLLSFPQKVLPFLLSFSLPTRGPGECIEKLAQDMHDIGST